ncbi:MAG: HU family DNA-binding protein [Rickettsiales bacterium]|jgi:integration host factor subunit alpha|nr:HU family DNA-binding protein [Rickettsiales bacterium]
MGRGVDSDLRKSHKMTVTRLDFAKEIHKLGFGMAASGHIVDIIFGEITESLRRGEPVKIKNFGTFGIKSKPQRMGRNPKTGESAPIPARRVPTFKAADNFRAAVVRSS